jgi:hypothetical protein
MQKRGPRPKVRFMQLASVTSAARGQYSGSTEKSFSRKSRHQSPAVIPAG